MPKFLLKQGFNSVSILLQRSSMKWQRQAKKVTVIVVGICIYLTFKTLVFFNVNDAYIKSSTGLDLPGNTNVVVNATPPSSKTSVTSQALITKNATCQTNFLGVPQYASLKNCTVCQQFTCSNFLFSSDKKEVYKDAREWMKTHPKVKKPDSYFIKTTEDCVAFRVDQGYHLQPLSKEEDEFPIAFNIIMHKEVEQTERLLRAIYRPQNEYCIHVDGKQSSATIEAIRSIAKCFKNVHVASKLERVTYAGFSRLKADINCMGDLLKVSTKWKYLFNLAGQSFPLKTNLEMVKILKIYNGANDIEGIYGKRVLRGRFTNEWMEIKTNTSHPGMRKTGRKNPKPPFDIDIVRGSAYGVFSRAFVQFIIHDEKAKALLEWSRRTWSPDEHYWATLHHTYSNPHLKTPGAYSGRLES